jgi:hypothetical protein
MARSGGFNFGLIALIIVVALAVYYVMDERDDDLEIDLGMSDVPAQVVELG